MSDFEHKDNSMSIFKNGYKEREGQPDYKGSGMIDGKKKQISCWLKKTRNGDTFFSCAIQDPYVKPDINNSASQGEPNPNYNPDAAINNNFDDDIPF